jgi:hypothetical protein
MTARQQLDYNQEVRRNREIVRSLWETLGRKPTLAEIEAALSTAE